MSSCSVVGEDVVEEDPGEDVVDEVEEDPGGAVVVVGSEMVVTCSPPSSRLKNQKRNTATAKMASRTPQSLMLRFRFLLLKASRSSASLCCRPSFWRIRFALRPDWMSSLTGKILQQYRRFSAKQSLFCEASRGETDC